MTTYHPRTKPFPHQSRATIKAVQHRNFALFFEPRCGKSKAALDTVAILALKEEVNRVAILAPKVALQVWDNQIRQHFPFPAELEDFQYRWTRGKSRDGPRVQFYLLNYERAASRRRKSRRWIRPYLHALEEWQPDIVICDESHRLKRAGGVSAQGVWQMVRRLRANNDGRPYVLLLSGTPTPRAKTDIFAQFRIMDPSVLGTSLREFEEQYVIKSRNPRTPWRVVGYQREDELDAHIRAHSFAISQEAAGLARQQFTQNLHTSLPPTVMEQYYELAEYFITQIKDQTITGSNAGAVRVRLLQVTGGFTTDGVCLHRAKLELLREYLGLLLDQQQHAVVYCRFSPEVEAAALEAERLGYRTYRFQGSTSDKDRARSLRAVQSSRVPTTIVFQVQTGSVALELSGACEAIYYSLPDGWENYWGSRNRLLGPNQRRPVRYTHLIARNTLDGSVLRSLREKENLHAALMQNPRRYLGMIQLQQTPMSIGGGDNHRS